MKFFTALSALAKLGLVHGQGNMVPSSASNNKVDGKPSVQRDIANLTFYTVEFLPKAPILRFESTLVIPASSPDASPDGDVQALWPGLQTDTLLQNVVTNVGGGPHEWYLLPFYCCHPAGKLTAQRRIYPGDLLTNSYIWDMAHNKWLDTWALTPGPEGSKAGLAAFQGGLTFDQTTASKEQSGLVPKPYDQPVLAIELQGHGTWDFGAVTWRNIIMEANTTETDWCTMVTTDNPMKLTTSPPVVRTEGNVTTCYISQMTFESPTDKKGSR
ncbi:hypothetical protein LHYA1_G005177 [Lachnellula hyalina]|uniref:Uncharacterized protein n=1 Tax=Lachnellula hyalina TaxID=1316788 RepID=A0A8H8R5C5_9HELO|nr:uncharacterized protein LHYA1_G005177 [Lachnellula hyalina]TVY28010.1 hypothetical protein LHYA1_G005177 [Lachnellula hyalina]